MDKKKWTFGIYLTVLALVFSIGLTFASVELPRPLHSTLVKATPALEGDSHGDETTVFRTQLFLEHYHLRIADALVDIRRPAARPLVVALHRIGSERALAALETALPDEDKEVRLHAAGALKRLRARAGISGPDSCTIVMAARDGLVLAGNNEDRNHPGTIVNFIPASGSFHGRIVFGYDDAFVQGGMNDQGLFLDGNALRPTGWQPEPGKPTFRGIVMMSILATCATCEDVKAFFERYNVPALGQARLPVADRTGASMVVEYGQGRVQFVRSDTWYQIATNFVMSNVKDGEYPCWRYKAADKIMSGAKKLSVDLVRDVLEKTSQEGNSLTVYSNIYDLKRGTVYVYHLRDFKKAVVLDLAEELKKGQRRLDLPSLFKPLCGSGPTARTGTNRDGYQDILGCWEEKPAGKFSERNRSLWLMNRRADGSPAITLIYDLTPRSHIWDHDLDVTIGTAPSPGRPTRDT